MKITTEFQNFIYFEHFSRALIAETFKNYTGNEKCYLFPLFFACVVSQNGRDGQKHQKSLLIVIRSKQNVPVSDEWKVKTFPSKFTDYVEVVGRPMPKTLGNKSKT